MEQPPSKEPRVPVNLRIKFRSETIEQFVERYAIDVSRGGIFIRTREPLAVGTQMRFDFQLQDTSPLMAGEGTVVWIREHDPSRAGVTPGMGVRFDKLTPASQPILDRILLDKGKRETSGPVSTSTTSVSATVSGKSGATALPVRRPSSTFSTVDPAAVAAAAAVQARAPAVSPAAAPPAAGAPATSTPATTTSAPTTTAATLVFGPAMTGPGGAPPAASRTASGLGASAPLNSTTSTPTPMGLKSPPIGAGAIPTLESQSGLRRLAMGPNLNTVGGGGTAGAARTKSPVPPARSPLATASAPASGAAAGAESGAPGVPTPVEDSEKTQIADGLPDFATDGSEPTHVGGPALGLAEIASGRIAATSANSKRTPTPAPEARVSLDHGLSPILAAAPGMPAARTNVPDGNASTGGAGRISASQAVVPAPGSTESRDPPPAGTAIAGSRPATTAATPSTTPRAQGTSAQKERKRPTAFIVVGVLVGAVAAVVIAARMSSRDHGAEAPAAPAATAPQAAAPAPANPTAATQEAPRTEPPAAAVAATGPAATGEAKPGEAKPAEAKPAEAKPAEAKPETKAAETKPPEAKTTTVAEAPPTPAPAAKAPGGRKQRIVARKKGLPLAKNDPAAADLGGEAVEAASAADAAVGNVARITSTPSGAEVLIDGQTVGKTPFQGKDIDPAVPHALTVRKDGFENYEHMVSVSDWVKGKGAGQSLKVPVKLRKAHGAADAEGAAGEKKPEKSAEPAAVESPKTEPAPATQP